MILQTKRPVPDYGYDPSNPNPNIPTTLAVKSQLIQNYTTEIRLADDYKAVVVGLDQPDPDKDPNTHIIAIRDNNSASIKHFSYAVSNGASWKRESWTLPKSQIVSQIVTGQNQDNRLVVFALSNENEIYYRQMGETLWTKCCTLPSDAYEIDISAAQFAGQLQLGASFRHDQDGDKALWIDWKNQTVMDATENHSCITSLAVGTLTLPRESIARNGMLIACRRHDGRSWISFIPYGEVASVYDFAPIDTGDYTGVQIVANGQCQFAALMPGDQLKYINGDSSSNVLSDIPIKQFCLSTANAQEDTDIALQLYAVSTSNQLLRQYLPEDSETWSDPVVLKNDIQSLAVADRDGYVDMITVSSAETYGALFEMHRAPESSNWHTAPISIQATSRAEAGSQITMGIDQIGRAGLPILNLLKITSDDGKIERYIQTDPAHDVWELEDYSLPDDLLALQITATQADNGRMVVACIASNWQVFFRAADETSWSHVNGTLNPNDTPFVLAAGPSDSGAQIYLGCNRSVSYQSLVMRVSEAVTTWQDNSEKYARIVSIAPGRAMAQAGIYVSAINTDNNAVIQWYPSDSQLIGDGTPHIQSDAAVCFLQVGASMTDEGVFFAIEQMPEGYQRLREYREDSSRRLFPDDDIHEFVAVLPASGDDAHRQQVFAITEEGTLKVTQQTHDLNWETPITLNNERTGLAAISCEIDSDYRRIGVADMGGIRIRHYMPRPASWDTAHIRYLGAGVSVQPTEFQSWVSQITVTDINGVGTPNARIFFAPNDSPVDVSVNGILYRLDPDDPPMSLVTDARGKATFTVLANSLTTTQFSVWADFISEDEGLIVQPNKNQQEYLATVTQEQLQSAQTKDTDGNTSPLFTNPAIVTQDAVDSINLAMDIAADSPETRQQTKAARWLNQRSTYNAARVVPRQNVRDYAYLQPTEAPERHFKITFGHGQVGAHKHAKLSRADALAELSHMRSPSYRIEADGEAPQTFDGNFGDIMQSSISKSIQVNSIVASEQQTMSRTRGKLRRFFNVVIEFVAEIIEDAVTGITKIVTYIWEGVLEFVQDATDLVEAIFSDLSASFDELFGWLGQLFDWQDVLNTQKQLKQSIFSLLNSVPPQIRAAGPAIQNWFGQDPTLTVSNALAGIPFSKSNEAVNNIVAMYEDPSLYGNSPSNYAAADSDIPQANWLMDQAAKLADSFQFITNFGDALNEAINNLISEFAEIAGESASEIQEALSQLADQMLAQQGNLTLDQLFSFAIDTTKEILETLLEALVDATVASLETIADIIQAIIDMLDTPLNLPLISDLYKTVINPGQDLSILDFITLLGALPATVTYKLIMQVKTGTLLTPVVSSTSDIVNSNYQMVYNPDLNILTNDTDSSIMLKTTDVGMSNTTFAITRFSMRTLATTCTVYSGIIMLASDELDFMGKTGNVPETLTDALSALSLFPSIIGQAAFYPLGWSPDSIGDTAGFTVWLGEFVFPAITAAKLGAADPVSEEGLDVMTSIFGVFDCMGVITAGVLQGLEVDTNNPLAVTQWVLSTTSCGVAALTTAVDIAKQPAAMGISAAYSPAAGMGALAIFDVVTSGFCIALDSTVTAVQLADAFGD